MARPAARVGEDLRARLGIAAALPAASGLGPRLTGPRLTGLRLLGLRLLLLRLLGLGLAGRRAADVLRRRLAPEHESDTARQEGKRERGEDERGFGSGRRGTIRPSHRPVPASGTASPSGSG